MKKYFLVIIFFVSLNVSAQQENQFIFMFDNSGSMLPYYQQPQSTFKLFSKALIKNSVKADDQADIMLFTKTDPKRGISSPKVLFKGDAESLIPDEVINKFTMMSGNDSRTGTTDLIEALDKGIAAIFIRGND